MTQTSPQGGGGCGASPRGQGATEQEGLAGGECEDGLLPESISFLQGLL